MIGILRDLPDWMLGTAAGAAAWFGASYTVLAPRAMENDLQEDVYPACLSELEADQERALTRAEERKREEAEYKREELRRKLRSRLNELADIKVEIEYYNSVKRQLRGIPFGELMPNVLPTVDLPSIEEVEQMEKAARSKLDALKGSINITLPRTPSRELMKSCVCAATTVMAGKRSTYAMSLASFRLVSPKELSTLKSDVSSVLRFDACGARPWEEV